MKFYRKKTYKKKKDWKCKVTKKVDGPDPSTSSTIYLNCRDSSCKIDKFIKQIYTPKVLFEPNRCFLGGVFIFEDRRSKLFDFLLCPGIYQRSTSATTHKIVLEKSLNKKRFKNKNNTFKVSSMSPQGFIKDNDILQYEYELKKTMRFLCEPACNSPNARCDKKKAVPKRVVLFYHFIVNDGGKRTGYTFIKLEGYSTKGLSKIPHMVDAVSKVVLGKKGKDPYDHRREKTLDGKTWEKDFLWKTEKWRRNKLAYYNTNIRTGDEFFVPQEKTNEILNSLGRGAVRFAEPPPTTRRAAMKRLGGNRSRRQGGRKKRRTRRRKRY
jgi:hypothetical protein